MLTKAGNLNGDQTMHYSRGEMHDSFEPHYVSHLPFPDVEHEIESGNEDYQHRGDPDSESWNAENRRGFDFVPDSVTLYGPGAGEYDVQIVRSVTGLQRDESSMLAELLHVDLSPHGGALINVANTHSDFQPRTPVQPDQGDVAEDGMSEWPPRSRSQEARQSLVNRSGTRAGGRVRGRPLTAEGRKEAKDVREAGGSCWRCFIMREKVSHIFSSTINCGQTLLKFKPKGGQPPLKIEILWAHWRRLTVNRNLFCPSRG